jgi:hypothetical protein
MPLPCYLSDEEFRENVADALDLAGGAAELTGPQRDKADQHHREAFGKIYAKLLKRGWTEAQIAAWPRGRDFERNIGLYLAYTRGSLGMDYDQAAIERMREDWLLELDSLADVSTPAPCGGGIGYGPMADAQAVFAAANWPDCAPLVRRCC